MGPMPPLDHPLRSKTSSSTTSITPITTTSRSEARSLFGVLCQYLCPSTTSCTTELRRHNAAGRTKSRQSVQHLIEGARLHFTNASKRCEGEHRIHRIEAGTPCTEQAIVSLVAFIAGQVPRSDFGQLHVTTLNDDGARVTRGICMQPEEKCLYA